ncbi:monovalent cation/H+ antiporter complex subunit F [Lachnospiraceae bacterium JLR.KK008]
MDTLTNVQNIVYIGALIILAVMLMLCLLRAILGPHVADRIVAVNMMGTMVMVMISILAMKMKEGYLIDICLIYAMISFLSVIVITKVYMGVYREKKMRKKEEHNV